MKQKIISIINSIVSRTTWYNEGFWKGVTKFWANIPFDLDIVNLGSGAGVYSFNYSFDTIKGRNFALAPQSLVHDFDILKNYFSYLREDGIVLITICPFTCLVSKYDKDHNFRYYTILHPATIQNFDDSERTRALLIKQNPFKQMPKVCIINTLKEFKNRFFSSKNFSIIDFRSSANMFVRDWQKQFGIENLEKPLSPKHKEEQASRKTTLKEMVSFCKERNLRPILVIPPMHKELSDLLSDTFCYYYVDSFIDGIDAPVYNYMRNEKFQNDEYFRNALFLNDLGAKVFTKELLTRLGL